MLVALAGCMAQPPQLASMMPRDQAFAAEQAFAATMARRDLAAFAAFVDDAAIFFAGPTPLRGKARVVAAGSGFFAGAQAPFSWKPDAVEVLDSGTQALSTGPVQLPEVRVVERFESIRRRAADGTGRVVFDKGGPASDAPAR
jgi:ketosteroid isomerase-like protein